LEWAVGAGWIQSEDDFNYWLDEQLDGVIAHQELPLLRKMFVASQAQDKQMLQTWADYSLALRDTTELRVEETDRAGALLRILRTLAVPNLGLVDSTLGKSQLAGIAWAAAHWSVDIMALLRAYGFSWLEQQIAAGIKLIPLGHLQGQRLLFELSKRIPNAAAASMDVLDDNIGYSCPAISMASCQHETQYTRLYRS